MCELTHTVDFNTQTARHGQEPGHGRQDQRLPHCKGAPAERIQIHWSDASGLNGAWFDAEKAWSWRYLNIHPHLRFILLLSWSAARVSYVCLGTVRRLSDLSRGTNWYSMFLI